MLIRKHRLALALASAPAAVVLLSLGCSSHDNPPPAPANNAALASLTVSGGNGDISPIFDSSTTSYTLPTNFAANPGPVTVKATAADPKATVTVNGAALQAGANSTPIPMTAGTNTISVQVRAEDQTMTKTYTITCRIYAQNTTVHVLDSTNGSAVANATLTVADASGRILQSGIPVDATGSTTLGLDGASAYNLSASGPGTAQSLFANFDSSRETTANFFCHPLGMINFPAQAPKFTAISYGPGDGTWTAVGSGNAISDKSANIGALKASAQGTAAIDSTAWSGYGMGLNVDAPVWAWNYWGAYATDELAVPVAGSTPALYRTTMEMWTPFNVTNPTASHYIDLVAYDVANNRTEQKLYVNLIDAASDASQPDLSALTPSNVVVQLVTHGLSRNIFVITPVDTNAVTYEPDIFFSLKNADGSIANILGYDVLRSTDGVRWSKVASQLFYAPTAASSLVYTDNDPSLKLGTTYYYKIRCFDGNTTNNGGYTQDSQPVGTVFLPPFTTNLAAPASESVSPTLRPALTFSITNPALFSSAVSDYFYFYLYIREKTRLSASYGQAYRFNFAANRFEAKNASGAWVDASSTVSVDAGHSNITVASPVGYFQPGVSYEWSIFGTSSSNSSSFRKYAFPFNDPTSTSYAVALSQGSTYEHSYGAVNGFFTLTIDPNAQ